MEETSKIAPMNPTKGIMEQFLRTLRPTLSFLCLFTILLGGIYPLLCTGILQLIYPEKSQGSLIHTEDKKLVGSSLIGQNFTQDKYFWGRLSATTPQAYNGLHSTGSNFGSNNPALINAVKSRIKQLETADPHNTVPIPVDLVTGSGSGLDPHISIAAANYQIDRVARARRLKHEDVAKIVQKYTSERQLGLFGEPHVNVLQVNLALDYEEKQHHDGR